jgi:hypothetical protein
MGLAAGKAQRIITHHFDIGKRTPNAERGLLNARVDDKYHPIQ